MYQLIAVDMDGTLLNHNKEISERNKKAIREAKAMGKTVVIATGRPLIGIKRYLEALEMTTEKDYVIAFNGALVQEAKSGRLIAKKTLALDDYKKLYEVSKTLGVHIQALSEHHVMTPIANQYTDVEANINLIETEVIPVEEVSETMTIVKVMFVDAPEKLDAAVQSLPEWVKETYTIVRSADIFLEFLDKSVDKGAGVAALAKELGLSANEVICVGDAGNDLAMIQYAGLGVAMANAFDEVKEAADYMTSSNEEDGVAEVIEKFMLESC